MTIENVRLICIWFFLVWVKNDIGDFSPNRVYTMGFWRTNRVGSGTSRLPPLLATEILILAAVLQGVDVIIELWLQNERRATTVLLP